MSMELMVLAMKAKVGNSAKKLVLLKIADNADENGECWPTYESIANHCEMSRRTVIRHMEQMISDGILSKEIRKGGPKGNRSNVFLISISKLKDLAEATGDNLTPVRVTEDHPTGDTGSPRTKDLKDLDLKRSSSGTSAEPENTPKSKKFDYTADDLKLSEWILSRIKIILPCVKQPNMNSWSNTIRLMREIDGLTHKQISEQFDWISRDPFWSTNILSPEKLRKQWDTITARRQPHGKFANSNQQNHRHESALFESPQANLDALMRRSDST
ncbi:helix-turn-helix domain-containing protein [Shewanella sp. D64]|uniref:helix-turn-helix domain-containing protein n=1 Tax=unclassified Shewanella TaxID=196818 RepID=UPI0022BA704F|nr:MULTISPECIES: helix-turn-helix domain-containing protein [unclassified Shewanella]MEC4724283.1 helix-turn-helix domain-containing protein [Shewanella sp. D64]MEC4738795.1 helix-turn-helix domain-containing protein [Shewanella sp. E94]WBJ97765.1 helix-turn-helix domain-containing protein [Shewanella sp. MTB7]